MLNLCRSIVIAIVLSGLFVSIGWSSNFPSQAIVAAENFAGFIDQEEYSTAYENASEFFQITLSKEDWIKQRQQTNFLVGGVQERKLVSVRSRTAYPRLPDGDYLVVYFEAQTEYKEKAAEVMLVKLDGDSWQVCSYRLK